MVSKGIPWGTVRNPCPVQITVFGEQAQLFGHVAGIRNGKYWAVSLIDFGKASGGFFKTSAFGAEARKEDNGKIERLSLKEIFNNIKNLNQK